MTRKNVYVKIKVGRESGWFPEIKAQNGEEAGRIVQEKYGDLGKVGATRSRNPINSLDDDLPGRSLFDDDR